MQGLTLEASSKENAVFMLVCRPLQMNNWVYKDDAIRPKGIVLDVPVCNKTVVRNIGKVRM